MKRALWFVPEKARRWFLGRSDDNIYNSDETLSTSKHTTPRTSEHLNDSRENTGLDVLVTDSLVTANLDEKDDVERTPHLASLELMPTEMLLDITSCLSRSSLVSACYSSRHIRNLLGVLIEDVLGKRSH